jgi:hypothetical protein
VFRYFSPKYIQDIGTFQDAGPLENNPLISALRETEALFPLVDEPDFVVSLGTGEPKPDQELSNGTRPDKWRHGAFPRLCRLFWEKMRDRKVSQAFQGHPRYHRLNLEFEGVEPKLDDTQSIPYTDLKAQEDKALSQTIENIAQCLIA